MSFTAEIFHSNTYGTMLRTGTAVYFCPTPEQLIYLISIAGSSFTVRTARDVANMVVQAMVTRIDERFLKDNNGNFQEHGAVPCTLHDDGSITAVWNTRPLISPSGAALTQLIEGMPQRSLGFYKDRLFIYYVTGWLNAQYFAHITAPRLAA